MAAFYNFQVNDALEFPHYASLERLLHRRNIVNYTVDNIRMLKTSYWYSSDSLFLLLCNNICLIGILFCILRMLVLQVLATKIS